jgi:hypothetical protein
MNASTTPGAARAARTARLGAVLWPAFLVAAVLNALVFSVIDPVSVHAPGASSPLGWSDTTLYTLGFFVAWALTSAAAALSVWLCNTADATRPPGTR